MASATKLGAEEKAAIVKEVCEHIEAVMKARLDELSSRIDEGFAQQTLAIDTLGRSKTAHRRFPEEAPRAFRPPDEVLPWEIIPDASTIEDDEDTEKRRAVNIMNMTSFTVEVENPDALSRLEKLVYGFHFEVFWAVAIMTNALLLGVEIQCAATVSARGAETPLGFEVIQCMYTVAFTIELALRVAALRSKAMFGETRWWNLFDMVIVLSSWLEVIVDLVVTTNGGVGANSGSVRILRLLRIMRLMRVLRVVRIIRFVRSLRRLLYSIVCTVRSMIWAIFLMGMIVYTFAILFTQAVTEHVTTLDEGEVPFFTQHWGSLSASMLTLFGSVCNGVSWVEVMSPLTHAGWFWEMLFILYICFTYFAVLNVITGVFCQSAMEGAMHDHDLAIQETLKKRRTITDRLRKLFAQIDAGGRGSLTLQQLERNLDNPDIRAFFQSLEINTDDAWTMFTLLAGGASKGLDCDDFVLGCLRLKGNAKSIDLAQLMHEHKRSNKMLKVFMRRVDARLDRLECFAECEDQGHGENPMGRMVLSGKPLAELR